MRRLATSAGALTLTRFAALSTLSRQAGEGLIAVTSQQLLRGGSRYFAAV